MNSRKSHFGSEKSQIASADPTSDLVLVLSDLAAPHRPLAHPKRHLPMRQSFLNAKVLGEAGLSNNC